MNGAKKQYFIPDDVPPAPYLEDSIPGHDERQGKSEGWCWFQTLTPLGLWGTMIITHEKTYAQACAMVNYAGGTLYRRFITRAVADGKIAVWRVE